jgi:uncharacterized protein YecA (UPF0149 family)
MKVIYPDVNDRTSQFITRWNQGKLQTEQLLRLTNGYPTTAAEKEIHEKNQQVKEEEMKKLIKMAPPEVIAKYIQQNSTVNEIRGLVRAKEQNKIGRNDPCFCGSGKKFKKCCGK